MPDPTTFRRAQAALKRAKVIVAALCWGPSHDARAYFREGWVALAAERSGERDPGPLERLGAHDRGLAYARQSFGGPSWSLDTARAVAACRVLAVAAARPEGEALNELPEALVSAVVPDLPAVLPACRHEAE